MCEVENKTTDLFEALKSFSEHHDTVKSIYKMIFDNREDYIYISDMETYEVLWVNKAMKVAFGDDVVGKKCYKVLQELSDPCVFCTNDIIKRRGKLLWLFDAKDNPKTNGHFLLQDSIVQWNGKNVRLEICIRLDDVDGIYFAQP